MIDVLTTQPTAKASNSITYRMGNPHLLAMTIDAGIFLPPATMEIFHPKSIRKSRWDLSRSLASPAKRTNNKKENGKSTLTRSSFSVYFTDFLLWWDIFFFVFLLPRLNLLTMDVCEVPESRLSAGRVQLIDPFSYRDPLWADFFPS